MSSVLLVCTGNICRSPMAEGFLRARLAERGIDAIEVASSGTNGLAGWGAAPEAVEAMAEHGVDISGHVARELARDQVRPARLVLGMTEAHARAVAGLMAPAAGRTFTLKEFVRLLDHLATAGRLHADGSPPELLVSAVALAEELRRTGTLPPPADADIADPLGLGTQAFRATAWEIEGLCRRLVDLVLDGDGDGAAPGPVPSTRAEAAVWGGREGTG